MNVWFCSDLHIGHKNIYKLRNGFTSEEHHRQIILSDWEKKVTKRDVVFCLGDIAFDEGAIDFVSSLRGRKMLIRGNHDDMPTKSYIRAFDEIYGIYKYKGMWLTHAPVHPEELRGKPNVHGHVHYATIPDNRYFNCCYENLSTLGYNFLISLEQLREQLNKHKPKEETHNG